MDLQSTSTHGYAKTISENAKYQDVEDPPSSSTCVYDYRSGVRLVPLRTNVNDCRRKNGTGESEDPKYHDTDDMNI